MRAGPRRAAELRRAFRHGRRSAADRVGAVIIGDRIGERLAFDAAVLAELAPGRARRFVGPAEDAVDFGQAAAHGAQIVVGQLAAEYLRQRAYDRPVVARL